MRRERNEWREYYDELIAGWTEEENAEEEHESRSTSLPSVKQLFQPSDITPPRSQEKKPIKSPFPPGRPKIHELEFWKSQVTSNIVAASGDLDHEAWISWIVPTFKMSPDIDGKLATWGDSRFNSIDVKLASALLA